MLQLFGKKARSDRRNTKYVVLFHSFDLPDQLPNLLPNLVFYFLDPIEESTDVFFYFLDPIGESPDFFFYFLDPIWEDSHKELDTMQRPRTMLQGCLAAVNSAKAKDVC
jgi:hypothetical protein